jgi:hypothetical protein
MYDKTLRYIVTRKLEDGGEETWWVTQALDYGQFVDGPYLTKEQAERICAQYNKTQNNEKF